MTWLFASGHAVDVVLAFMAIEAIWLASRKWAPLDIALMLSPGVLMLVALRFALTNAHWLLVATALTLSLPLHLADLRRRGRR